MLTALAHLILACSRSRSLIADSIRDNPEQWEMRGDDKLVHLPSKTDVHIGFDYLLVFVHGRLETKGKFGWAERRIVVRASRDLVARGRAKAARQFDKALKAALTGDE